MLNTCLSLGFREECARRLKQLRVRHKSHLEKFLVKLILAFILPLAFTQVLRAQLIEVTAQGTVVNVESGSNDFGVQTGDLFTETFEINSATMGASDGAGIELYVGMGSDSVTAGAFTMSLPDAISVAQIYSDAPGLEYGYHFRETFNTAIPVYADINLLGSTPAVAPTLSLSSINDFPLSDFGPSDDGEIDYIDNVNDLGFSAEISSYTVTTVAAPEPSSLSFVFLAIGILLCMRRYVRPRLG